MLCVWAISNLKCLLIEIVKPHLNHIYFCIPEIFKTNVYTRLNLCSRDVNLKKLFLSKKNRCKIFVSKLSGIERIFIKIRL